MQDWKKIRGTETTSPTEGDTLMPPRVLEGRSSNGGACCHARIIIPEVGALSKARGTGNGSHQRDCRIPSPKHSHVFSLFATLSTDKPTREQKPLTHFT